MMDSTACLIGSDSPYVYRAFQFLPARQYDMQEYDPIPCHLKREMSLVAARLDFLRFSEDGRHACV